MNRESESFCPQRRKEKMVGKGYRKGKKKEKKNGNPEK
jgi:hypothetical protein